MNKLQKYYSQKALDYGMKNERLSKIFGLVSNRVKGKKVLDVGCSTGYLGSKLKQKGAYVAGVDISVPAIKVAKKKLDLAKIVDLNNEKLPFETSSFDFVIGSEVIEHLFDPLSTLKEFKRILKKDGILIITTPNLLYWSNRIRFLFGKFQYTSQGVFDESHIHFYVYRTLVNDLNISGLKIVQEDHLYAGKSFILNIIRKRFPGAFAYQFIVVCKKF